MITAKVIRPFRCKGKTIQAGQIIRFPQESLGKLAGLVEVIEDLTETERLLQQNSTDFVRFCLAHESTMPDGCPVKRDRFDPFTECLGWQIKTRGTLH